MAPVARLRPMLLEAEDWPIPPKRPLRLMLKPSDKSPCLMLCIWGRFQSRSLIFWQVVMLPRVFTEAQRLEMAKGIIRDGSKDHLRTLKLGRATRGALSKPMKLFWAEEAEKIRCCIAHDHAYEN